MAHGYLRDGYGTHGESDSDRDDDRGRRDRDRGAMFGQGDDRWSDRGDRQTSGLDREHGFGGFQGDHSGTREERRSFSAHPDDHYRSWRDRHMQELDRDYEEYCREREQQFHQDFDSWRRQRQGNPQPLQPGMTQTGMSHDPSGELQLSEESIVDNGSDPMGEATLGTNSSDDNRSGRGRR
ncbi:MAG TPA: hypothetical protein VIV07_02540 [Sphingomicrobium sp.]